MKKPDTMVKEKDKGKESSLEYWWNEFLFRKHFTFETTLPPEVCADNLERLETLREDLWTEIWRRQRLMSYVYTHDTDVYSFELEKQRRSKTSYTTTARARGKIYSDHRGVTLVEGEVTLGILSQVSLLFAMGVVVFVFFGTVRFMLSQFPFFMFALLVIGILFFTWWRMLADRNQLIEQVRMVILREKVKR